MRGRVMVVDDDRDMVDMLLLGLRRRGFEATGHASGADALAALDAAYDAVVADLNMRGMSGLDLCARVAAERPDTPVIVITAFGSMDTAISGIRAGAYDFITKPLEVEALALALDRAVQHGALRRELRTLRERVAAGPTFDDIVGASQPMAELVEMVRRVGPSDASVLVAGESGTGKELVARAVHRASGRADGPFVAVNCAAVPEALLESELFGHVRGAFTDARSARPGLFARASGGTLFLDEIGDLPLALQPKLLRALQERVIRPVGSDAEVPVDVRIIAATHRDLGEEVVAGRFREDLYYRVDVVRLEVPPLRARGGDVLLLAQHFLASVARRSGRPVDAIDEGAARRLLAWPWPGNVRELQNVIERAVALARGAQVTVDELPARLREAAPAQLADDGAPEDLLPLDEVERRHILRVLAAVEGNKRLAARILGLDRKTLYRKLERYGVDPGDV
jgi:DNA-binding NtrC family response regulator